MMTSKYGSVQQACDGCTVRYEIVDRISRGAYGVVYRGWDRVSEELVAIKYEIDGFSLSTQREISVLRSLRRHRNIVNLREVIADAASDLVFVVMEYLPFDLNRFTAAMPKPCPMPEVKRMMWQILHGVAFLHHNGVTHRDLKPSNILVDGQGSLKICDFGMSRRLETTEESPSGANTPGVVTLWYRSPELLVGGEKPYTSAIDMWSVGCIMAELVTKEVLFPGNTEIDQLCRIADIMASPNPVTLRIAIAAAASAAEVPWLDALGFDLLEKLLAMDPDARITAKDALRHAWFKQYNSRSPK